MLQEGHYKVDFGADLHGVGGRIRLKDGVITGADTDGQYRYEGEYAENGGLITAKIKVIANSLDARSVFNTAGGAFELNLSGRPTPDGFALGGNSPFGGKAIQIAGRYLPTVKLGEL